MNDDLITRLKQFASAQKCRDCIIASECRNHECLFYRAADTLYIQNKQIEKLNEQIERLII